MTRRLFLALLALAAAVFVGWQTIADAQEEEIDKSRFVQFVERQISTPDRQIRLGRIDGALSSDVRISEITIADRQGVWLTIENAHLVWSRLALLRGQLDVDLLEADRIEIARTPNAPEEETPPEAEFEIPELPVGVDIDKLSVGRVDIAAGIIGPQVALSVDGEMHLNDGSLDASLKIERLDEPGSLVLEAAFSNETSILDLNLQLSEPENGVVANALNIPDRPAVSFAIEGSGPLDDFKADISLAADGQQLVGGTTTISQTGSGLRFVAEVDGNLQPLVPPLYQDLVRGGSQLTIDATRAEDGAIRIARAEITSGVARLDLSADITADGFPTALEVDVRLGSAGGDPVNLPGGGGAATVQSGTINVTLGGQVDNTWVATFDLQDLRTPLLSAERARIMGSGLAANMAQPDARRVTFEVSGSAEGLSSDDEDVATALGDRIALEARGNWSGGQPIDVQLARLENANAEASFLGKIDPATGLDGDYTLRARNLALFSGLTGQDLGGSVELAAEGTVGFDGVELRLDLDGSGQDLKLGIPPVDGLFEGRTTLSGGVGRSRTGFRFEELTLQNPQVMARVHGAYGAEDVALSARAELTDIAVLADRASGAATLEASLTGTAERPEIEATLEAPRLRLTGRPLTGLSAKFVGALPEGRLLNGDLSLTGNLDGVPLDVSAHLASLEDGSKVLEDLAARAGRTTASGALTLRADGLYEGAVSLESPDLSAIAPLFLADASGALSADIVLSVADGGQSADIEAQARSLRFNTIEVGAADIDLEGSNLLDAPMLSGRASASRVKVGSFEIDSVEATADRSGDTTNVEVEANLSRGTLVAAGAIDAVDGGFDLTVRQLRLTHEGVAAELASATRVSVRDGEVAVADANLRVGGGGVTVSGTVGERIDLSAAIDALPLSLGNAFMPDLGLTGTVSGRLEATGTTDAPVADFQLTGRGINAAPLRRFDVANLAFEASGHYENGTARIQASTNVAGGSVVMSGQVGDVLDLRVELGGLPVALANAVAPDLDLAGSVSGTIDATGSLAAPDVVFELTGQGLSARPLREAGLGPLAATASGRYAGDAVSLQALQVSGNGIALSARGRVPLSGGGLDIAVSGTVPLSVSDRVLATRGARLSGTINVDARVTGSLESPRFAGNLTADGVTFADPESGLRLTGIRLRAALSGERLVVDELSATLGDGSVSVSGSVGIVPGSGFPADLRIALREARYEDPRLIAATLSGDLALTGPLVGQPLLSGQIRIDRAEITVPERFGGTAAMLDVRHVNAPADVLDTLRKADLLGGERGADAGNQPSGIRLDLTIDAPARIFVRGRGLDTELGGSLRLTGPVSNLRPVGAFQMIRGRIDILGQRISFDRGEVTLFGDLDPYLDFQATTTNASITVILSVVGRASDPEITFSSSPDLPQDEILAQLLFGRSLNDLSAFQIAQLAAAAAQLAGGGGPSILEQLRVSTGLDNLDVVTTEGGGAAVQAGRYIDENVYLGVTAGEDQSGVSVNLDVTDNLTIKGEAGTRDSSIGIFFEKEY